MVEDVILLDVSSADAEQGHDVKGALGTVFQQYLLEVISFVSRERLLFP